VIRERRGLILNGEVHSQHFEGSAGRDQIGSALSVPLLASYGPVGVLNLARFVSGSRFTGNEFTRVERLAAPVAAAVERLQRTRLAHEIYYQLVAAESGPASAQVPRGASEIHNYQIAFAHRSSRGLDGDLCDRVSHPNAVHSLLFIDVAGSGPPAAASAAFFQGLFVAGASAKRSAAGLMAHLNKEYLPRSGVRPAAAVWIAQLSPTGGLTSCSAGTVAPMWVAADGSHLVRLGRGGPVLGASASGRYVEESVRLLPGDTVVAVSDGVIAAQDNSAEAFGQGRLEELLVSLRRQPLDRVADAVCEAALGHCGWPLPAEDLTVLALRFTPGN
jgi:serine phosphatase RsbU (regulator of sigma subunit)